MIKREEVFFKNLNVSQELFDITQRKDKGVGDKKEYQFLMPAPEVFVKYGITNVSGVQDPTMIRMLRSVTY